MYEWNLKGQGHEIFISDFFHFPRDPVAVLALFQIWNKIRDDIRQPEVLTGKNV